jgi:hypothetical protein
MMRLRRDGQDELLGRAVGQGGSEDPGLQVSFVGVTGVLAVTGDSAADSEDRADENDDEPDGAGSLAALNDWRPLAGPQHAGPPASWFEVGDHAKRDYSSQFLFRQMSEPT